MLFTKLKSFKGGGLNGIDNVWLISYDYGKKGNKQKISKTDIFKAATKKVAFTRSLMKLANVANKMKRGEKFKIAILFKNKYEFYILKKRYCHPKKILAVSFNETETIFKKIKPKS